MQFLLRFRGVLALAVLTFACDDSAAPERSLARVTIKTTGYDVPARLEILVSRWRWLDSTGTTVIDTVSANSSFSIPDAAPGDTVYVSLRLMLDFPWAPYSPTWEDRCAVGPSRDGTSEVAEEPTTLAFAIHCTPRLGNLQIAVGFPHEYSTAPHPHPAFDVIVSGPGTFWTYGQVPEGRSHAGFTVPHGRRVVLLIVPAHCTVRNANPQLAYLSPVWLFVQVTFVVTSRDDPLLPCA